MPDKSSPDGVLLVGSVPLNNTTEVFTTVCKELSGCVQAIPDGETGERGNFLAWQIPKFPRETLRPHVGGIDFPETGIPEYTIEDVQPTLYDKAAIESYAKFVELRKQGVIPPGIRFQVCLTTPFNVVTCLCKPEAHSAMGPLYALRIEDTIRAILDNIPHEDLVIQWDLPYEVLALEHDSGRLKDDAYKAFFSPVRPGIMRRIGRFNAHIPPNVGVGFHLCYGDYQHRHVIEPEDLGLMVDFANDIVAQLKDKNRIEWIHMPVPQDRTDAAYFQPLDKLQLHGSKLYLGLVHANDAEGTRKRIETAKTVWPHPFGVATECGMGRTPRDEVGSILSISRNVVT